MFPSLSEAYDALSASNKKAHIKSTKQKYSWEIIIISFNKYRYNSVKSEVKLQIHVQESQISFQNETFNVIAHFHSNSNMKQAM